MQGDLVNRILVVLRRFDAEDKEGIARQLVEVLELESHESLTRKARDAMNRDFTESELFKLEVLERIIRDNRRLFPGDLSPDFPDDLDAPKFGK